MRTAIVATLALLGACSLNNPSSDHRGGAADASAPGSDAGPGLDGAPPDGGADASSDAGAPFDAGPWPAACTPVDREDPDRGYLFCDEDLSWAAADEACIRWGFDGLASLNDERESLWFASRLIQRAPGINHAWIGLGDAEMDGAFVWVDGEAAAYVAWHNNLAFPDMNSPLLNCVHARSSSNGNWFIDIPCDDPRPYACEGAPRGFPYAHPMMPPPMCSAGVMSGESYLFCEEQVNWQEAEQRCDAWGYRLVTIDVDRTQAEVYADTMAIGGPRWWIGLSDLEMDGQFRWTDGSSPSYDNYHSSSPSGNALHSCIELHNVDGTWRDGPCRAARPYVCGPL